MKAEKKALAHSITASVEAKLSDGTEQSKKLKKTIEKAANKLAKKLVKLLKKEEKKKKSVEKAATKPKKSKSILDLTPKPSEKPAAAQQIDKTFRESRHSTPKTSPSKLPKLDGSFHLMKRAVYYDT